MGKLEFLNAALAACGVLAVLVAINHMSAQTSRAVRCAYVTTGVGLLGQLLSAVVPWLVLALGLNFRAYFDWQENYDTLLFGGVVALVIGSRRMPSMLPEPWVGRVSLMVTLLSWGAFLVTVRA